MVFRDMYFNEHRTNFLIYIQQIEEILSFFSKILPDITNKEEILNIQKAIQVLENQKEELLEKRRFIDFTEN